MIGRAGGGLIPYFPPGSSGIYSAISGKVQFKILHIASSVFVETDSLACNLKSVDPLTPPLTLNVYVVADLFSIVFHNGAYEIM